MTLIAVLTFRFNVYGFPAYQIRHETLKMTVDDPGSAVLNRGILMDGGTQFTVLENRRKLAHYSARTGPKIW